MWDDKKKKKKKRYFFLFNDILLLCRRETHKRFWLRIHITLRSPHVSVEEIENSSFNNEFRIHCRTRSFILYATTPDMKKDWVQDLRHSISGTHPEEKKDSAKKVETADQEKKEVVKTKKEPKTDQKKKSDSDNSEEISDEPKKKTRTSQT